MTVNSGNKRHLDDAKFSKTASSGGFLTSTASQVINFSPAITGLQFRAKDESVDDMTIKVNDETNTHLVTASIPYAPGDLVIRKITIVESGKQFNYEALHI